MPGQLLEYKAHHKSCIDNWKCIAHKKNKAFIPNAIKTILVQTSQMNQGHIKMAIFLSGVTTCNLCKILREKNHANPDVFATLVAQFPVVMMKDKRQIIF